MPDMEEYPKEMDSSDFVKSVNLDNLNTSQDETETKKDTREAKPKREGLSESNSVGRKTSTQDSKRDSESEQLNATTSGRESGTRSKYDLNKKYSNKEIDEIVSSVTDFVDGKVVITGEVTDDIKTIASQYVTEGVSKEGRGVLDEYYTDGGIVDAVRNILSRLIPQSSTPRVLDVVS